MKKGKILAVYNIFMSLIYVLNFVFYYTTKHSFIANNIFVVIFGDILVRELIRVKILDNEPDIDNELFYKKSKTILQVCLIVSVIAIFIRRYFIKF